jgi:5-methylcytosine-specific restriction endonuclease McrA
MTERIRGRTRATRNRRILAACPVCYICGGDIDLTLKWPDKMSGVIDHEAPIIRGGTEHRSNLRPAHAYCNRQKADKDHAPIVRRSRSLD